MIRNFFAAVLTSSVLLASPSFGYFLDGEGHYGLRPETQTNPAFSGDTGLYQATLQSFRLLGEAKANDKLSMKMEFTIFDDPRRAFLGDNAEPQDCSNTESYDADDGDGSTEKERNANTGSASNCSGRHQNTSEPGYQPYSPKITEVYAVYGMDFCLLEVGRRPRDWGMGVFLDNGHKPFASSRSIFDGATCKINLQKTQSLGFSIGLDRLVETGASIDVGLPDDGNTYGPSKTSDDFDQLFLTIEYDDRKSNSGASFNRNIGIYFANIIGTSKYGTEESGSKTKAKTDVKFADLFTGFYFSNFTLRNELLFRLGKSADPSWSRYGGISQDSDDSSQKNNVDAIAVAGDFTITMGRSGSRVGPKEYFQGNASSHDMFFEYAYAPGDRDGYYNETERRKTSSGRKVGALAFHRNYKPALLLLSDNPELDKYRVDGIYDPGRVMNMTVLTAGYRYNDLEYGNFELKFISAQLNKSMPKPVKDEIHAAELEAEAAQEANSTAPGPVRRPVGYSGKHLGYEVDMIYTRHLGKNLTMGGAGAVAIPGAAWKVEPKDDPEISYLLRGSVTFNF